MSLFSLFGDFYDELVVYILLFKSSIMLNYVSMLINISDVYLYQKHLRSELMIPLALFLS